PASGTNNTVQDVAISKNTFTGSFVAIELVPGNTVGNRLERTRIEDNTLTQGTSGIVLDIVGSAGRPVSTSNVIDDTLISGNVFRGNSSSNITLLGGVTDPGPGTQAVNNLINNTRIINNLMTGSTQFGPIGIKGGVEGSSQNAIVNVAIVNN